MIIDNLKLAGKIPFQIAKIHKNAKKIHIQKKKYPFAVA